MAIKSLKHNNLTWHNITSLNEEDLAWLKKEFHFHHLDLVDCQGENEHPKIDYYRDYFFIIAHFPEINFKTGVISTHEVDIFVGNKYLITIQKQKNKTLNNIFYRLTTNISARKRYMSKSSGWLLYKILAEMFKKFQITTSYIYKRINNAEKEIFEEETIASIKTLSDIRRMVLKLKLLLSPQRVVVNSLQKTKMDFFDNELRLYFDDVGDFLDKMLVIAQNQKDLIDGLYETNESMVSHRTNKIIKLLTIFSVAMLPLTLFTGIYGMNIKLPWAHTPIIVWSVFLFLLFVIIGILLYFRKKDLI